jgi:hypothetical protein
MTGPVIAWTLVVWLGGGYGYLSVSGIASESACNSLYYNIENSGAIYKGKQHWCIQYEAARVGEK